MLIKIDKKLKINLEVLQINCTEKNEKKVTK